MSYRSTGFKLLVQICCGLLLKMECRFCCCHSLEPSALNYKHLRAMVEVKLSYRFVYLSKHQFEQSFSDGIVVVILWSRVRAITSIFGQLLTAIQGYYIVWLFVNHCTALVATVLWDVCILVKEDLQPHVKTCWEMLRPKVETTILLLLGKPSLNNYKINRTAAPCNNMLRNILSKSWKNYSTSDGGIDAWV